MLVRHWAGAVAAAARGLPPPAVPRPVRDRGAWAGRRGRETWAVMLCWPLVAVSCGSVGCDGGVWDATTAAGEVRAERGGREAETKQAESPLNSHPRSHPTRRSCLQRGRGEGVERAR